MEKAFYLYGKFYNPNSEAVPGEGRYDVVIYRGVNPREHRAIGSLEGVFEAPSNLFASHPEGENIVVGRDGMDEFAKQVGGRFERFRNGVFRCVPESIGEIARRVNNSLDKR